MVFSSTFHFNLCSLRGVSPAKGFSLKQRSTSKSHNSRELPLKPSRVQQAGQPIWKLDTQTQRAGKADSPVSARGKQTSQRVRPFTCEYIRSCSFPLTDPARPGSAAVLPWWAANSPALSPGTGSRACLGHVPVPTWLGEHFPLWCQWPAGTGHAPSADSSVLELRQGFRSGTAASWGTNLYLNWMK